MKNFIKISIYTGTVILYIYFIYVIILGIFFEDYILPNDPLLFKLFIFYIFSIILSYIFIIYSKNLDELANSRIKLLNKSYIFGTLIIFTILGFVL